jgi:S-formylglutathione hydrolase
MKPTHPSLISSLSISLALALGAAGLMFSQNAAPAPDAQKGPAKGKAAPPPSRPGSMEKIVVHGKSLEGNLEGDSADRDVFVYLPLSYATNKNRRYPVVYFLHGYGAHAEAYLNLMWVSDTADKDAAAGKSKEMILVFPDAYTIYNGSMYSSSPTTGDWEAFVTKDLVTYIDSHYRTIADRDSRGLSGHSMGGYGTWRIGMKYPEVYSSLYAMSSCCLMNNPGAARGGAGATKQAAPKQVALPSPPAAPAADGKGKQAKGGRGGAFGNVNFAEAAAWSPNPMNPPQFFDLPTKDGQAVPAIAAKWVANSPLAMVDQYLPNLKKYKSIAMDVGLQDSLMGSNKELDESLTKLGITHTYETYEGDHTNHVKDRFDEKVLPFFSNNLVFTAAKKKK